MSLAFLEIIVSIIIRSELPSDIAAIHSLTKEAFLNAPYAAHTEHFIVDALRDAGALTLSLVAEEDGSVVGHVAVSPISISGKNLGWHGLGPISVAPEHQKKGIGSGLVHAALQRLKEKKSAGCVLAGDPAYYNRFGFVHQSSIIFPDVPAEFFLVNPFSEIVPQGIAKFHEAFATKG